MKVKLSGYYFWHWLAGFWSYYCNHSIWWALLHFICGPIYLAYRIVFHTHMFTK